MFLNLPIELKRAILRFIPRNETAQIMHEQESLSLQYVRNYKYSPLYKNLIWECLKPYQVKSLYYGDKDSSFKI